MWKNLDWQFYWKTILIMVSFFEIHGLKKAEKHEEIKVPEEKYTVNMITSECYTRTCHIRTHYTIDRINQARQQSTMTGKKIPTIWSTKLSDCINKAVMKIRSPPQALFSASSWVDWIIYTWSTRNSNATNLLSALAIVRCHWNSWKFAGVIHEKRLQLTTLLEYSNI